MTGDIDLGIDHLTDVTMIGRGGFSVVYAASHTLFKRRMAVKVLNELTKESERLRFERECEVLGRLSDHPNVVSVYNAGYTAADRPYLLMELVEGGTLQDRLERNGPLPWPEAVDYLLPICDALAVAHGEAILHRDVKPENILLADDGKPRLADFGIASLRDATGATSTHVTASMLHTAPETFENTRDERSDLYSLASTMFALIVGRAPFWHEEDLSIHPLMNRLLNEPAPAMPAELAPPELNFFLQRALAKDPAHRPQTAVDFARELRAITGNQVGSGTAQQQDVTPQQAQQPVRDLPNAPDHYVHHPISHEPLTPQSRAAQTPAPQTFAPQAAAQNFSAQPPSNATWSNPVDDRPRTNSGNTLSAAGWYHAAGDPAGTQRYWDGAQWQGNAEPVYQAGPVTHSGLGSAGRRIGARSIDLAIWFAIWIGFLLLIVPSDDDTSASYLQLLVLGLWTTAGIAAYEIGCVAAAGATLGKMLFGLRVVSEDGSPAGFSGAAMRMVFFIVLSVLSAAIWIPSLLMLVAAGFAINAVMNHERRQTLWDKQAKTIVIKR